MYLKASTFFIKAQTQSWPRLRPGPSLKFEGVWPSHPFNRSEIQPTHQTLKERNVSFEMKIILSFSKYNF